MALKWNILLIIIISIWLKNTVQHQGVSLNNEEYSVDSLEMEDINQVSDYDDNYCFGTLNQDANLFKLSGYTDIEQASAELIDRAGLHDLQDFVNECRSKLNLTNKE